MDSVAWYRPHGLPEDGEKFELMKQIEGKTMVGVYYRM